LKRELIISGDGSHTIYVPELNEHYHSIHGAVQESATVFIRNGLEFCKGDPLIFEVGFGTGLNALLTCANCTKNKRKTVYVAIDKYPLENDLTENINYASFAGTDGKELLRRINSAKWGSEEIINEYFTLCKRESDLVNEIPEGQYNLIYFDAFGPDKQPEMWTNSIFENISAITRKGGILVTYSAKGSVKRALRSVGFSIELLPGPPHKREVLRAIKL
jgi:tRNA U34 5-methylaminomethyl-2-thiouridine-forming methyltransferase MnmC